MSGTAQRRHELAPPPLALRCCLQANPKPMSGPAGQAAKAAAKEALRQDKGSSLLLIAVTGATVASGMWWWLKKTSEVRAGGRH